MIIPTNSIILKCNSHRARSKAGLSRNPKATALYSFRRASTGGYYAVPEELGKEILSRGIAGVTKLRGPYDDLMNCW
jgi:hypothetical protein